MAKSIKTIQPTTIDEYIAGFPSNIQQHLQAIRTTIKKAAPKAEETIKYAIPTFTLNGNLVSFGAWETHIGLYPAPRVVEAFKKELSGYGGGKSTVQFPLDKPLPLPLISKIVKYRMEKLLEKSSLKANKK